MLLLKESKAVSVYANSERCAKHTEHQLSEISLFLRKIIHLYLANQVLTIKSKITSCSILECNSLQADFFFKFSETDYIFILQFNIG